MDGGKFFVMGEDGEAKLVIMSVEEYQRLLLGKLQRQVKDIETINQEIIKAQLEQEEAQKVSEARVVEPRIPKPSPIARVDLRSEVIDPSFDFEGPKIEVDDL